MIRLMCYGFLLLALVAAPWMGLYPVLGTKILCYALFACAFHLLLGYVGNPSNVQEHAHGDLRLVGGDCAKCRTHHTTFVSGTSWLPSHRREELFQSITMQELRVLRWAVIPKLVQRC